MKVIASASTADGIISIMRKYWYSDVTITQFSCTRWDIVKANGDTMDGYHVTHIKGRWILEEVES